LPQAAGLADELYKEFKVKSKLIPGTDGIFDVVVDDKCIFSRAEAKRFPKPGEIAKKLRNS
jgi:selT/selW/selH-like putative selenoprotein